MAGAGKKTFTAGETLTASDVNNYLGDQAVMYFGGTAARSSAIPTPTVGMTSYRGDTKQIESYDGAEWRGMSGLQLVKSQAIGTGVSSVVVSDAFSTTYDHYRIMIGGNCAGSTNLFLQLTLTGSSTNYASAVIYAPYIGGAPAAAGLGTSSWSQAGDVTTTGCSFNVELANPFNTTYTGFRHLGTGIATNGNALAINGVHGAATSYTSFTITTSTGTITGGTIYVYGYAK